MILGSISMASYIESVSLCVNSSIKRWQMAVQSLFALSVRMYSGVANLSV